jgi:protein AbiQ
MRWLNKNGDNKVPYVEYKDQRKNKFLCGIVFKINDFNYYAPVSSNTKKHPNNFIIFDNAGEKPIASIRFSYMIPVPKDLLNIKNIKNETDQQYKKLLQKEYNIVNKYSEIITKFANNVYSRKVYKPENRNSKQCINFKKLEQKCSEYVMLTSLEKEGKVY